MTYAKPDALVSTQWLADHLSAPDVRVVDATWAMPGSGIVPRDEYDAQHIPGAVFFNIDEIADTNSPLPHMLPPPEKFSSRVRRLGLGNGNRVIVYDRNGGAMAAARVWWMFRTFGHKDVSVLSGGLSKWIKEGGAIEDLPPMPRERHFISRTNSLLVRDINHMLANVSSGKEQVLDARSSARFKGEEAEPRAGARSGHIPGSLNLPWAELLNPEDKTLLPAPELRQKFEAAGVDFSRPVVTTCGSGVTASLLALGLHLLGHEDVAVYDGSWAEWGGRDDTPIVQG